MRVTVCCFKGVTVTVTQRSVTLSWHATWPPGRVVVACVKTAGTTVLDLSVSCVALITTRTLSALWRTLMHVYVSLFGIHWVVFR